MKKILAATITIIGAIFISAYTVCMAIFRANSLKDMASSEYILLLIVGIIAIITGGALFILEFKKKQ